MIDEDPEARRRVGRASAEFLGVVLVAIAGLSALVLWHLSRRGRLIRERLGRPRPVVWPVDDRDGGDRGTDGERIEKSP